MASGFHCFESLGMEKKWTICGESNYFCFCIIVLLRRPSVIHTLYTKVIKSGIEIKKGDQTNTLDAE